MLDRSVRSSSLSVILASGDRPRSRRLALACYAHQTYARRELIVVDDGQACPADIEAITAVGGRLVHARPGSPPGTKLNRGASEAQGRFCLKVNADDWYAPYFLERVLTAVETGRQGVCRPVLAFLRPFLCLDLTEWEVRRSTAIPLSGATLLFERETWKERPFRAVASHEDSWFLRDQAALGVRPQPIEALETYLAVRYRDGPQDRGDTWTRRWEDQPVAFAFPEPPLYERPPEALLPAWAIRAYREPRDESPDAAADRPSAR